MDNKKKYGLMIYSLKGPTYNVGDYIQSLAAKQYLPKTDIFINREKLKDYSADKVDMIMNGWYIRNPKQFQPSAKINPLYISFHLNHKVSEEILGDEKNISYLKSKSPIGCRDYYTMQALQSKGIDAYFSSCLTTTLDLEYSSKEKTDNIYFADALSHLEVWDVYINNLMHRNIFEALLKILLGYKYNSRFNKRKILLDKLFSKEILTKAINISHHLSQKHSEEKRFEQAQNILKKYATAKLVVTSRIHVALPCLALGTPVIFINHGFGNDSRFKNILEMINTINIDDKEKITANFQLPKSGKITIEDIAANPTKHKEYAEKLKSKCYDFVNKS